MKLFQLFFQIISVNLNIKCIKYIYLWVFYWLNWLLIMIMICPTSPTAGLSDRPPPVRAGPHNPCSLLIKILKIPDKNNENARSEFFRKSIDNNWHNHVDVKIESLKHVQQNFSSKWKISQFASLLLRLLLSPQLIRVEIFPKLRKMLSHERCEKYHGNFWTWSLHHRYGLHCICLVYLHVRYVYDFLWKNTTNSSGC